MIEFKEPISFVIPTRNNLKYLKLAYKSIRNNTKQLHFICIADDFSNDGTWEWLTEIMNTDKRVKAIRNEGPKRLGHTILYDRIIKELVETNIFCIFHADMYMAPGFDEEIYEYIKPKTIVSATRIEPPLHPVGKEKLIFDFGLEPEEFNETKFIKFCEIKKEELKDKITYGIFAPWACYKSDFVEIGGHDPLYAPQSKEDSDIFNRFLLNGFTFVQSWNMFVYHLTCRGSRFNPTLTNLGKNSSEWDEQNIRSARNFVRKWGSFVKHDEYLHPIVPHKYNIVGIIKNCDINHLGIFEILFDKTYVENGQDIIKRYIDFEQKNTKYDLSERLYAVEADSEDYADFQSQVVDENDVVVEIDCKKTTQKDMEMFFNLSEYLDQTNGEPGMYDNGIFKVKINRLIPKEKELIILKKDN